MIYDAVNGISEHLVETSKFQHVVQMKVMLLVEKEMSIDFMRVDVQDLCVAWVFEAAQCRKRSDDVRHDCQMSSLQVCKEETEDDVAEVFRWNACWKQWLWRHTS